MQSADLVASHEGSWTSAAVNRFDARLMPASFDACGGLMYCIT